MLTGVSGKNQDRSIEDQEIRRNRRNRRKRRNRRNWRDPSGEEEGEESSLGERFLSLQNTGKCGGIGET